MIKEHFYFLFRRKYRGEVGRIRFPEAGLPRAAALPHLSEDVSGRGNAAHPHLHHALPGDRTFQVSILYRLGAKKRWIWMDLGFSSNGDLDTRFFKKRKENCENKRF